LAVDATSEFGSVAIRRGHQTSAETRLHSPDGFGHLIIQAIEDVLWKAELTLADIDCFAAASGPGSFTGVRVGLSAVKGLAEAMNKPVVGISNLRALSLSGHSPLRAVALDARRNHVYGAVYNSRAELVVEETVGPWGDWIKRIPAGAELIAVAGGPCQTAGISFTVAPPYLATAVAECAEIAQGRDWTDPVGLDANYVRRSDAELFWKDA
jgi:tRNA threonylcarbamoyladenosine biosynthesis protein TsaB